MRKGNINRIYLVVILFAYLSLTCEKQVFDNPYDPAYVIEPPSNLKAVPISESSIKLTWKNNDSPKIHFQIERKSTDQFKPVGETGSNDTIFIDYNLISGTYYHYRIKALVETNESPYSGIITSWVGKTFTKSYGWNKDDHATCIKQTSDGGYIIAGHTESIGAGDHDILLVKFDKDGNEEWFQLFGGTETDLGYSVDETTDGGYIITGVTYSYGAGICDLWLVRTDNKGNEIWNRAFGGEYADIGEDVNQTIDGGFIITGQTRSGSSNNNDDVWVIKTDVSGNEEWTETFGGIYNGDAGRSVAQTTDGGYIITGYTWSYGLHPPNIWLIKADAEGDLVWNYTYGGNASEWGNCVVQALDGGYVIVGTTFSFGAGLWDVWLIETDAQGIEEWSRTFGGSSSEHGTYIAQTIDGGYIITGDTESYGEGKSDVWLIKTDSFGNEEWNRAFGGAEDEHGNCVVPSNDGGYIVVGTTQSYGLGGLDIWLIKTDPEGNVYE